MAGRCRKSVGEEEETSKMRVYHCESCGGEIIADENQAATKCPYCDNPVVMKGQLPGRSETGLRDSVQAG